MHRDDDRFLRKRGARGRQTRAGVGGTVAASTAARAREKTLKTITGLKTPKEKRGLAMQREQNYFAGQDHRLHYRKIADQGWPIGSGAVESACRQRQCRFKRPGQFWTAPGLRNLCALESARHNHHWEELWNSTKP